MRSTPKISTWSSLLLTSLVLLLMSMALGIGGGSDPMVLAAELAAPNPPAGKGKAATATPTGTPGSANVPAAPGNGSKPTPRAKQPTATSTAVPTATSTAQAGATATSTAQAGATSTSTPAAGTPTVTFTPTATATATLTPTATITGAVANDDIGSAKLISSFPYSTTQDTTAATNAGDDPDMQAGAGVNSNTVWFKLVAPSSGGMRINTFGSSYDTVLAAFTGARGSLSLVESNDDAGTDYQSEIAFNVQAGTTYFVEVAQYDTAGGGTLQLSAALGGAIVPTSTPTVTPTYIPWSTWTPRPTVTGTPTIVPGARPANDDVNSAAAVTTLPFTVTLDTTGATSANDDPDMGSDSGRNSNTVWYRLVSPITGSLRINTFGSNYDTVLAVYTGSRGSFALVDSSDDVGNDGASEVVINAVAGATYFVEVGDYGEDPRGGTLRLAMSSGVGSVYLAGTPTVTGPAVAGFIAAAPPEVRTTRIVTRDNRYFAQTGYRIEMNSFYDFFQKRGGVRTFGYPVSWEFDLLGFKVQFFQRGILQLKPDGSVATMNLLDDGLMPYTRINSSTFPASERDLIESAPSPSDPQYGAKAIAFLEENVPDEWDGQPVDFLKTFMGTVRYEDAFPNGEGNRALVPLLNLELFGLPTSKPYYDPANENFIYQRFQRGILHYDKATGLTQGLLLADYLKSIITGRDLPADLESQALASRFYRQYAPSKAGSVARPQLLPGTTLTGAFDSDLPR